MILMVFSLHYGGRLFVPRIYRCLSLEQLQLRFGLRYRASVETVDVRIVRQLKKRRNARTHTRAYLFQYMFQLISTFPSVLLELRLDLSQRVRSVVVILELSSGSDHRTIQMSHCGSCCCHCFFFAASLSLIVFFVYNTM